MDSNSFPSTCWSRIVDARGGREDADRRAALDLLAGAYWKPVFCYVRARWGKSAEDARDLVQEFFLWMLETEFLTRVDRERGRFRAVLKVALQHWLTDEHRKATREKRGGGRAPLSLDVSDDEARRIDVSDPRGRSPEELLDEAWRTETLARALRTLEEELKRDGKETVFAIFRDYYLSDAGKLDYAEVAARHGVSTVDVSNRLQQAKARYREVLRRLVLETVRGDDDLQAELNWLVGGGRR